MKLCGDSASNTPRGYMLGVRNRMTFRMPRQTFEERAD